MQDLSSAKFAGASRKRDPAQPTDIADKIVAFQRRQAAATRPKERAERPLIVSSSTVRPTRPASPRKLHAPPLTNTSNPLSQSTGRAVEADADEFSRRLNISAQSPRSMHSRSHAGPSGGSPGKLYNPNAESVSRHVLTAEPESMSDAASSSYASRGPVLQASRLHQASSASRAAVDSHRQLFDHRKDDPVRFAVLTRPQVSPGRNQDRPTPTPKSSGDYVSASSTSSASYAQSTLSSNFTLSTADSSAPSSLFDNPNGHARRSEDSASGTNAFSMQLKKLYRAISALEAKILGEDRDKDQDEGDDRAGQQRIGVLLKGRPGSAGAMEAKGSEDESERWKRLLVDHKELAEKVHHLLSLTLAPTVPASLRNIPTKYNLIIRLWTHAFHRLLEVLRRAASPPNNSPVALEYLQDFIYYAYTFYTGLLEERNLIEFRGWWVEALGDLARYRMATCALLEHQQRTTSSNLTVSAVAKASEQLDTPRPASPNASGSSHRAQLPHATVASPTPAARIDDSLQPSQHAPRQQFEEPSVGLAAARAMELEPEKERWRQIAREWFAKGLAGTPGNGKLHHHIGILSREKESSEEELRGMYHFVKSMITLHPYSTSREAILQLWSPAAQARRQAPDADVADLFILLHGMLFTNIQLDDFRWVLERFEEKLQIEGGAVIEERDWIMMAVVNLGAILQYGRQDAMLKRIAGIGGREPGSTRAGASPVVSGASAGRVKLIAKKPDDRMDVDGEEDRKSNLSPAISEAMPVLAAPELELPQALKLGMQLAFSMFAHALQKPMRKPSLYAHSTLNPYITILLTFLATAVKDSQALAVLERAIPWADLAAFLNTIPRRLLFREQQKERGEGAVLLTSGCHPMPEDWCLRGLGWGGKRVYPMGFWGKETNSEERNVEMEVLDKVEVRDQMDGVIENDDDDQADARRNILALRWVRVARAGLKIAKYVDGFDYVPAASEEERGQFKVEGALAEKVTRWQEEERREREGEERRLRGRRWEEDSMDVDDEEALVVEESTDESEDENDSDEIKALKARRRYLQSLLQSSTRRGASPPVCRPRPRGPRQARARPTLQIVPGYTILVIDTNILLSSLSMFSSLVESQQWTVVVPLPVIMELDGLATNMSALGEVASSALAFITSHVRSRSTSLKVQTSRGNYLSSLNVRTEQVDFASDEASWERNMDDLILRAAIWQDEHWVDRSAMLKSDGRARDTSGAAKVVLLSLDRMLRLKARSRQLSAANEQDLASILAMGR
ncbi:uncharacterized protein LAESUDRAFT_643103 [Laetiporus sulphureus 93-53]|uniref:PIN domain-containing protein n=1 Tax=Laetiporus sulphureus 93-53 TaxID=1314785 RepID=A0A165HBD4_9APHY|nr:uncharacterized protein LAESUDRAFT_643103 [Laetiporus sulphureus 93-53]KZT11502.1 hypothetical protein LAESUDRAFT_643103 [Laetiporus sulphureus 93-53]